jgi:hypothetical protein
VSCRYSRQVGVVGQFVGLLSDAIGLRLGARCATHRGQMIADGVDDFFSRGIDFVALPGFGLLHLSLRAQLGKRFLAGNILLSDLLGGALLSGLLISDRALHGRRLGVHRDSLLCAFDPGFCRFGMGLRGLGIGDGFDAVGLIALRGLGLLELSLGSQ